MLHQRGLARDKVLFRILKTKSSSACDICEKLKQNIKCITVLSEDELCELWRYMKGILLEAQKLYTETPCGNNRYVKEYSLTVKLIRSITAMALETISQRTFIPNVLLQCVMILHSTILTSIKDVQGKDEISHFLEMWWKLDMVWKEKVIVNALKHLIQNCESSLQHVKRLYEVKSAIVLLKSVGDIQVLLSLARNKIVMSLEEGQMLLLHLFTLGKQYILGIDNNVKVMLQSATPNLIIGYANLYATAWLKATENSKKVIAQSCVQNIIFHYFRIRRDSKGKGKLGKNLLTFLTALHDNKNQAVKRMICNQCKPLLSKHLKAPGSYIRCNAAEILFMTHPIQYTSPNKNKISVGLQKYYKAINELLKDSNYQVCSITVNGILKLLEAHWSIIPNNVIREWINSLLNYTTTHSNSELRVEVFLGLRKILANGDSHTILKDYLPKFANSIYDVDINVVDAFVELLWHAQNDANIPFWDVIPLTYILDRIETTEDASMLQRLIKLVWLRISSNDIENMAITNEIVHLGLNNIAAIRKLCFHSKCVLNWNASLKIIKTISMVLNTESDYLPAPIVQTEKRLKRSKSTNNENERNNRKLKDVKYCKYKDFDNQSIHILIDVVAILLIANKKHIVDAEYNEKEKSILQTIANSLPQLSNSFKDTPINESIMLLFSLIPSKFFANDIAIINTFVTQLCNPYIPDDTLLTVLYVLMKWEKGETILFALTNLFKESIDLHSQYSQENYAMNSLKIQDNNLELSLRILKHLLHVEHQSVLTNKYHKDVLKFWETLHMLRSLIENTLNNKWTVNNLLSEEQIVEFYKYYVAMVPLLHKPDTFDASTHLSEIVSWIKRTVVRHIPDMDVIENYHISVHIIKHTLEISDMMLKQCEGTPKLCCDIVLLYCNCLSQCGGVVFMNNVLETLMIILDFSQVAYENGEQNLLNIVIPNFLYATMITFTRYSEEIIIKYTNNMKALPAITQKYFSVVDTTLHKREMYVSFIRIMFNTAVSSISTGITCVLQGVSITADDILSKEFPYLAEKILKTIFRKKKHQELGIQMLTNTITSYSNIDTISVLLIIYKILKTTLKVPINRLKNITLAMKLHSQRQSYNTQLERSMENAMNIVINAILNT